jgi:signal transduction histidine kinase
LFNLFDNAVKYSVPKSRLSIKLLNSTDKKNLIFEITNTTLLINKEDIPNIFERFYKTSNTAGKKGFGLGLAIVKKIVEKNNGTIDIYYDDNLKDITFIIIFPLYS